VDVVAAVQNKPAALGAERHANSPALALCCVRLYDARVLVAAACAQVDGSALGQHMEVRMRASCLVPARTDCDCGLLCAVSDIHRPFCCHLPAARASIAVPGFKQDFYLSTLKEAVLAANPALAGKVQQALEAAAAASPGGSEASKEA
jgi:hypothetical protein